MRMKMRVLAIALVTVMAAANNGEAFGGWESSPANAWRADKPIPEDYRRQINTARPENADSQLQGSFLAVNTPAGMTRLRRSVHKEDYWTLSLHFATQIRQTLCSVATAVTILNALPIARPLDEVYKPYPYFTQTNYFNDDVAKLRSYQHTLTDGMTLEMAAAAMRVHGAEVRAIHAADTSVDGMRDAIKENLARAGDFVAVNYYRSFVGQPKGAHFSPVGAYDAESDTFLIMDVARYKFPPVWVRTDDLYRAINTHDTETPLTRGFLLVSAGR